MALTSPATPHPVVRLTAVDGRVRRPARTSFPMNSPAPGVGRGPLVGHWSGRRWHNSPLSGWWSGTRCGGVIYGGKPITAPYRRAPTMSLRYGWLQRLPGDQIVAQSTGLLSQRTFDPLLRCRLVLFQTLADISFAMLEHGIDVPRQLGRRRRDRPFVPQSAVHAPEISPQRRV